MRNENQLSLAFRGKPMFPSCADRGDSHRHDFIRFVGWLDEAPAEKFNQVFAAYARNPLGVILASCAIEGYINYGSPINAIGVNTMAGISISQPVELTANVINQPVFSTRKVTTSVSVYDGQTVVIGGLMREDVQKTEDKVPIIGDIPLVGRAFRTNTEQHTKKNLVIFVTAKIITPAGLPLNEEEEEGLLPPELPEVPAYKK